MPRDPKVACDRSSQEDSKTNFIRGRGISCLGRVWPHSSVCALEVLFTIFTTRRKPSTAQDVTYRKKIHASFHITRWQQDEVTCLSNTVWLKINSLETKHQQLSGRPGVGFFSVATRSSGNSDRLFESGLLGCLCDRPLLFQSVNER